MQYIQRGRQLCNRNVEDNNPSAEDEDHEDCHLVAPTRSVIEFNALRSPLDLVDT